MEQRVRDIIESLQKFDLDLRVSEKTTLNFRYDGYATRLVVECDNTDYEAKIAELHEENAKLAGEIEDKDDEIQANDNMISDLKDELKEAGDEIDDQVDEINALKHKIEILESELEKGRE